MAFAYQDAKVIWEQGGELSYYRVSAIWQRVVVRGALVLTGAGLLSLAVSAWHSWQVVQEREQLARAHVQIQTALSQALPEVSMTTTQGVNTQQVLDLTARIQERDWLIQTLIQSTSSAWLPITRPWKTSCAVWVSTSACARRLWRPHRKAVPTAHTTRG